MVIGAVIHQEVVSSNRGTTSKQAGWIIFIKLLVEKTEKT